MYRCENKKEKPGGNSPSKTLSATPNENSGSSACSTLSGSANTHQPLAMNHSSGESSSEGSTLRLRSARGEAIWNRFVESQALRSTFLKAPEKWYREFWNLSHDTPAFRNAEPNVGHKALAELCRRFPHRVSIVTQNIDGLHAKSGCDENCALEVHGRVGRFRCPNPLCEANNSKVLEREECLTTPLTTTPESPEYTSSEPHCPYCNAPAMPLALLFDETYECHSAFKWEQAKEKMRNADVVVYVGTSLSVSCVYRSLEYARDKNAPIFNINIDRLQFIYERFDYQKYERHLRYQRELVEHESSTESEIGSDDQTDDRASDGTDESSGSEWSERSVKKRRIKGSTEEDKMKKERCYEEPVDKTRSAGRTGVGTVVGTEAGVGSWKGFETVVESSDAQKTVRPMKKQKTGEMKREDLLEGEFSDSPNAIGTDNLKSKIEVVKLEENYIRGFEHRGRRDELLVSSSVHHACGLHEDEESVQTDSTHSSLPKNDIKQSQEDQKNEESNDLRNQCQENLPKSVCDVNSYIPSTSPESPLSSEVPSPSSQLPVSHTDSPPSDRSATAHRPNGIRLLKFDALKEKSEVSKNEFMAQFFVAGKSGQGSGAMID